LGSARGDPSKKQKVKAKIASATNPLPVKSEGRIPMSAKPDSLVRQSNLVKQTETGQSIIHTIDSNNKSSGTAIGGSNSQTKNNFKQTAQFGPTMTLVKS